MHGSHDTTTLRQAFRFQINAPTSKRFFSLIIRGGWLLFWSGKLVVQSTHVVHLPFILLFSVRKHGSCAPSGAQRYKYGWYGLIAHVSNAVFNDTLLDIGQSCQMVKTELQSENYHLIFTHWTFPATRGSFLADENKLITESAQKQVMIWSWFAVEPPYSVSLALNQATRW